MKHLPGAPPMVKFVVGCGCINCAVCTWTSKDNERNKSRGARLSIENSHIAQADRENPWSTRAVCCLPHRGPAGPFCFLEGGLIRGVTNKMTAICRYRICCTGKGFGPGPAQAETNLSLYVGTLGQRQSSEPRSNPTARLNLRLT